MLLPIRRVSGIWYLVSGIRNTKYLILNTRYRKSFGFTLIELLVVISIIGILVTIAGVSYTNAQRKARDTKRKNDLKSVQQALALYFEQNGKYPDASGGGIITCNAGGDTANIFWGSEFICNSTTYMKQLPQDPSGYYYDSAGTPPDRYDISAKLENTNDPEMAQMPCAPKGQGPPNYRNFCVANP